MYTDKFKTRSGLCTAYALRQGQYELTTVATTWQQYDITLYTESKHSAYYVRVAKTQGDIVSVMSVGTYDKVSTARRRYKAVATAYKLIVNSWIDG